MPTVDIYNIQKVKVGELDLKDDIFGVEVRGDVLHEVVTWQRACRRSGCACTKTRGEVNGGGRKPWRQKGTGRARAGSNRSPVWKGGRPSSVPVPGATPTLSPEGAPADRENGLEQQAGKRPTGGAGGLSPHEPRTKDFVAVLKTFELNKALFVSLEDNWALEFCARNVPESR